MVYNKEYQQAYKIRNKDKVNARARDWYKAKMSQDPSYLKNKRKTFDLKKKDVRKFINELKSLFGCSKCPENNPACLDFHHIGKDKKLSISTMCKQGARLYDIIDEMFKCVVLCSNCHRKEHGRDRDNFEFNNPIYQEILEKVKNLF